MVVKFNKLCVLTVIIQLLLLQYSIPLYSQQLANSDWDIVINDLYKETQVIANTFYVFPYFYFYDDGKNPNAQATSKRIDNHNKPDGTILFGANLLQRELQSKWNNKLGNYSVIGILAHEFAHILQFKMGLHNTLPTKLMELHADFMAGWYMATRDIFTPVFDDIRQSMEGFYEMGDYAVNDRDHHGKPEERLSAFLGGVTMVRQAASQNYILNRNEAAQMGLNFVSQFPYQGPPIGGRQGKFGCSLMGKVKLSRTEKRPVDDIVSFFTNDYPSKPEPLDLKGKSLDDWLLGR